MEYSASLDQPGVLAVPSPPKSFPLPPFLPFLFKALMVPGGRPPWITTNDPISPSTGTRRTPPRSRCDSFSFSVRSKYWTPLFLGRLLVAGLKRIANRRRG